MPCKAFLCPETGRSVSFADAPEYFENLKVAVGDHGSAGLMCAEDVQAVIEDIQHNPHAKQAGCYLTPSHLFPGNNCRREYFIEKYLDYESDPRVMWDALVGTMYHRLRHEVGRRAARYRHEVTVPGDILRGEVEDLPPGFKECEDGVVRCEVFPGLWLSGTVDRATEDWSEIVDYKVNKWPTTFASKGHVPPDYAEVSKWGPGSAHEEWPIQLSVYALIIEKARAPFGRKGRVEKLWVWRTYKQTQHRGYTFRKIPVDRWPEDRLKSVLGDHVKQHLDWMKRGREAPLHVLPEVPLDGRDKQMFNGQKCTKYCPVQHVCELHAGGGFEF